jgi:hypothetical protein
MATIPDSKLIAISTPYAMNGVLYEAHRDYFGKSDSNVLVWQSETSVMNPTIDADLIQRELERDPDSAKSEWLATFRDVLATFRDVLEAAFSLDRFGLASSRAGVNYRHHLPLPILDSSIHQVGAMTPSPLPSDTARGTALSWIWQRPGIRLLILLSSSVS